MFRRLPDWDFLVVYLKLSDSAQIIRIGALGLYEMLVTLFLAVTSALCGDEDPVNGILCLPENKRQEYGLTV